MPTEAHKEPPQMTSNPDQFPHPEDLTTKTPHAGGEEVPADVRENPVVEYDLPLERAVKEQKIGNIPNTLEEGFIYAPYEPSAHETQKKKSKRGLVILGVGAATVATAFGAWFGSTGGGQVNLPPKPVASAPPNPGQPPVAEKPPVVIPPVAETTPAAIRPEIAPVAEQKFYTETGEEQTFEELKEQNTLYASEYGGFGGELAYRGFFERAETMINHYPTEQEVRNNLGYPADHKLTKADYKLAMGVYVKAYDVLYDQPGTNKGNNLYAVLTRIADETVDQRYDRLNDSDASNDSFNATLELSERLTQFTHTDTLKATAGNVYVMKAGADMSKSIDAKDVRWMMPGTRIQLSEG